MRALRQARELLPFPMLGIDTDNGSEFINNELLEYCREEKLTFTRSRPYKENPNLCAEEIFHALRRDYSGQFKDGQLRTLQSRVKVR